MATNKSNIVMTIMVLVIVVLAAIVLYTLVVKPKVSGYAVEKQNEGAQIALGSILQVVANCQTFPVALSENQTINLVALECLQAPQGTQQAQAAQ